MKRQAKKERNETPATREQEVLRLTGRDRDLFVKALLNPPAPGKRLVAAAERYKKRVKV